MDIEVGKVILVKNAWLKEYRGGDQLSAGESNKVYYHKFWMRSKQTARIIKWYKDNEDKITTIKNISNSDSLDK